MTEHSGAGTGGGAGMDVHPMIGGPQGDGAGEGDGHGDGNGRGNGRGEDEGEGDGCGTGSGEGYGIDSKDLDVAQWLDAYVSVLNVGVHSRLNPFAPRFVPTAKVRVTLAPFIQAQLELWGADD